MKKFRAETIEDVIEIMDEIIRNNRLRDSRVAYFTVMYRTTTYMVKKYCDEGGFFEDDERMRRLDVVFGNFYFDSFFADQHFHTQPPSRSWKVSFDAADDPSKVLLQHLLVGMNAHISLDLGIATAMIANGDLNASLKRDFMRLNDILSSLIHLVRTEVSSVSPMLEVLRAFTLNSEKLFIDQMIRFARNRAWDFAEELNQLPREAWAQRIAEQDEFVANISNTILAPGRFFNPMIQFIQQYEKTAPHDVISGLAGEKWYSDAHAKVLQVLGNVDDPNIELMKRETHLMRAIIHETQDDIPSV